jgi:ribosome-binding factor A
MPREFPRSRRVGEQIQRSLAVLIQQEIKDPRLGMTSISAVQVTRDLSSARVFVTVMGDDAVVKDSMNVLKRAAGFLRSSLAKQMRTRTIPELRFVYDRSLEEGVRLGALINEAVSGINKDEQED